MVHDLLTADELRGDAEDRVNELSLADWIALRDPPNLAFADCVHRLVALNGSARTLGGTEAEARRYPLLDEAMVLLQNIIQVGCCSTTTAASEFTGLLQLGNCTGVRRMAIDVDHPRLRSTSGQRQPQEHLRRDQVPLRRQHELDGLAGRIDRAIKIRPAARNLDVGLVNPPGPIRTSQFPPNAPIQNGRVTLDPAPDRDMVDRKTPFGHDLLQVAVSERISQVPTNAEEDYHVLEVPSSEQRRPLSGHDSPYQISSLAFATHPAGLPE